MRLLIPSSVIGVVTLMLAFQGVAQSETPPANQYVKFPEVGVELVKPEGFVVAEEFAGFIMESKGASVMTLSMAMTFEQVMKGNSNAVLTKKGAVVDERRSMTVDGRRAELIRIRQRSPEGEFVRWTLIVDRRGHTKIILGQAPDRYASELGKPIMSSLMSTRMIAVADAPPEDLGFSVKSSKKLTFSPEPAIIGKRVVYRGEGPPQAPETPVFMAVAPLDPPVEIDRREYAIERLTWLNHMRMKDLLSLREVEIDGLEGIEVIAKAQADERMAPMVVYQVLLFLPDSTYYLMLGKVGKRLSNEYLPEFREMARSFKRAR